MVQQFENAVNRYKQVILDELYEKDITCWIAGGAMRDYFMGIPINTDYDLFFSSKKDFEKAKKYLVNKQKTPVLYEGENSIKISYKGKKFDLIKKVFPKTSQETIQLFDFTASMIAVDRNNVYHGETTFIDLSKRQKF